MQSLKRCADAKAQKQQIVKGIIAQLTAKAPEYVRDLEIALEPQLFIVFINLLQIYRTAELPRLWTAVVSCAHVYVCRLLFRFCVKNVLLINLISIFSMQKDRK